MRPAPPNTREPVSLAYGSGDLGELSFIAGLNDLSDDETLDGGTVAVSKLRMPAVAKDTSSNLSSK